LIQIVGEQECLACQVCFFLSIPFQPCLTVPLSALIFDRYLAIVSSRCSPYYCRSGYRLIARHLLLIPPCSVFTTLQGDVSRTSPVFELGAIALVLIHLARYPPEFTNILPTPIPVIQSKPTNVEKTVMRNWCETMQASDVSSRFCRAKFHSSSLCPSPLRRDKNNGHARLNLVALHRQSFSRPSSSVLMECQMTERSYLECNHQNPADSALSAAASSVGSTARSIVYFAR
jgi:hypothetical protein